MGPQRSAFKKDVPGPTLSTATQLTDTQREEELEAWTEPESGGEVQTALLVVVALDFSQVASVCEHQSLHQPGQHQTNTPDLVTALPRRERHVEGCYATHANCQVLSKDKE